MHSTRWRLERFLNRFKSNVEFALRRRYNVVIFFVDLFDMIRRSFLKKHSSSNVMMKVLKPKALKYGLGTPHISVECYSNCIPRI